MDLVLVLSWNHTGNFLVILHVKVFQVLKVTFAQTQIR